MKTWTADHRQLAAAVVFVRDELRRLAQALPKAQGDELGRLAQLLSIGLKARSTRREGSL